MSNIALKSKMLGVEKNGRERSIIVSHVTIRQSISFLLLRLITVEVITAIGVILFLIFLISTDIRERVGNSIIVFNIPIFVFLVLAKIVLMVVVTLQWLNEYYEITAKEIIHRSGLIFKKEERYKLDHLGSLNMEQGVFGKILNYGTLSLFNWVLEKNVFLYLIHNPLKYYNILQNILPDTDRETDIFPKHITENHKD
ncbi:PH domain-containing protein [Candidatus Roizmanbacteria bacterium]|nr:PH domain-containing protein [Candidatus Roizmanbacteria bacterium]